MDRSHADNLHAALAQPRRPSLVVSDLFRLIMNRAVHLDRQLRLGAVKIENIRTDRMLPTELAAVQASSP